jgi:hypothetical protein
MLARSSSNGLGRFAVAVLLVGLTATPGHSEFDVTARRAKDFDRVRSVVVFPLTCPRGIDCRILELRLAEDLAEVGKYSVISTADLRQMAYDRALDLSLPGTLAALIRSLGVDAIILGGVPGVPPEKRWIFESVNGSKTFMPEPNTPTEVATLTCFSLDGRKLFEGAADGDSRHGLQIQQEQVARKFRSILKKALE